VRKSVQKDDARDVIIAVHGESVDVFGELLLPQGLVAIAMRLTMINWSKVKH
jgi:hypothetical protein